ncbi:RND family efflux transporter, MFP subunit, partial [Xenococcus sp. PCC 7305]|uniref:efflux RND transporter periplasmic adaptor subunit n=1 Tax=Xenococcus sp. PCC 7305 TaxID=102125 RepID=UPI0002ABDB03
MMLAIAKPALSGQGHGHGNSAFESEGNEAATTVKVAPEVAQNLEIQVEPVKRQRLAVAIKTPGQIESLPNKRVEVNTPIDQAQVVELLVEPGQAVNAGEPIAVLSSPGLVELRVNSQNQRAEAEAALQQAQADLQLAKQNYRRFSDIAAAEIVQAKSQLKFAQEQYQRDSELAKRGVIPRRNALESETQLAGAQAQLTNAESQREVIGAENQLQKAQADVRAAESRLKLSETQYLTRLQQLGIQANERGLLTVRAPISGKVATRPANIGQSFQDAGGTLMTIIDDSSVFATADIYEKDLSQIRQGQQVRVKVPGIPNRTFTGNVTVIGAVVQGERRVIPVQAKLDNPNGELKPGMFASLEVLTNQTTSATLVIPQEAVVEANGKNLVFLKEGEVYEPLAVSLGESSGGWVAVEEGLTTGDLIVTQGGIMLYAESLKGGGKDDEEGHEHDEEGHEHDEEGHEHDEEGHEHDEEGHEHSEKTDDRSTNSSNSLLSLWVLSLLGVGGMT